jgi:hypothetical protein
VSKQIRITVAVIIGAVILLGGYDVIWIWLFGVPNSISSVITKYGHIYSTIPFALGYLMGHFFGQD